MQQVRRRMIGADRGAADGIDLHPDRIANRDGALLDRRAVRPDPADLLLRIVNDDTQSVVVAEDAGVTHLPPAFHVERYLVVHDLHRVPTDTATDHRAGT